MHANLQQCSHTRLWQSQLEQCYPVWTAAGVYPVSGRHDGQTWKELVVTASKLQELGVPCSTGQNTPPALDEKAKQLWNSGTEHIKDA